MHYTLISTQADLVKMAETIQTSNPALLAVDTEFMRKSTYWPQLCLIQLALDERIFIVDAISLHQELSPLKNIFQNPNIKKVFHSGRQDLEIFFHLWCELPNNIGDTQVLGMVTGFGECVSYEKINEALLGKKIDKSQQHTDWARRPLSDRQLTYAATDVKDLCAIYKHLSEKAGPKQAYLQDEMAKLTAPETYTPNSEDAWLKIKCRWPMSGLFWGRLQAMAALRESTAATQNIAKTHLIKDEVLIDLAAAKTCTPILFEEKNVPKTLWSLLETAWHNAEPQYRPMPPCLSAAQEDMLELLKLLLRHTSDTKKIASKLIATKDALQTFILDMPNSPLCQGWRYDIFGKTAIDILEGRSFIGFNLQKKGLVIHHLSTDDR